MAISKNPGPPLVSIFKGLVDAIPQRWRTKLGITTTVRKQPVDVGPTALSGTLVASSVEQEFTDERKKTDVTLNDPTGQTMIEYVRTKDGQVGTRTVKYVPEGTAAPSFTELIQEFNQDASGNGWSEQITTTVPNLFGGNDYTVERPDVTPQDFDPMLPKVETSETIAGIASLPTLAANDLQKKEEQVTEQTKRVTTLSQDMSSLPLTLVSKKTNQDKQIVIVTRTLSLDTVTPSVPTSLLDVSFTKLGDGTAVQEVLGVANVFGGNDYTRERADRVPPKFGTLIEVRDFTEVVAGTATDPTLAAGELLREEKQETAFTKRVTVRYRDLSSLPISITHYETDQNKEIVTIVETWQLASVSAAVPTATTDTKWEPLGDAVPYTDGTAIQTVASTSVFAHPVYAIERPDRVPAEFGALLEITETETTSVGTISPPSLAAGEIMRREEQVTAFTKRITVRARDLASLPKTLVSYDTSRAKQVVTVTKIWELDSTTPAVPSATLDVSFDPLGDGTAIEIQKSEAVFPGPVYGISIENQIPPKFRSHIPTNVSEITSTGTANPTPTLATGEISHEEQQIDAFNIRIKSVNFGAISSPVTFTDTEITEEFGGGILDVVYVLDTSGTSIVDTGLRVVSSELTDLGNGWEILTTKQLQDASWPILPGQDYDEQFDVVLPFTDQIVDVGTDIGTPRVKITPKDVWRQENHTIDISAISTILDAYNLVFPGTTNLNSKLPDILTNLASVFEVNSGNGSYSETGSGYWSIRGSYALSIRGAGNGSAAVVADANFLLIPPFKPSAPTTRVVFFLPNPVTTADVLTKLTAILGASVSAWPAFDPKPVTVVCVSRKVSVRAEANQHTQSGGSGIGGDTGCDTPDCVACDAASTSGMGTSTEVGITIKTIRIPPCLHDLINLHDTQDQSATAQAYAFDGSSWGSCAPPEFGPADTGVITLTATGSVDSDAVATSETGYTAGTYLLDTTAQPYKYGYAIIHAECVTL